MVCRLVQDQKIGLGEHELCQRDAAALAAGEIRDALEDIVPGEEEGSQHAADLGVVHVGPGVLEFLEEGLFGVQDRVLLVIVGDQDPGAQRHAAGIRGQKAVDDLQDGGLACAVVADDGDVFAALQLKAYVPEKLLGAEGLGEAFRLEDIVPLTARLMDFSRLKDLSFRMTSSWWRISACWFR